MEGRRRAAAAAAAAGPCVCTTHQRTNALYRPRSPTSPRRTAPVTWHASTRARRGTLHARGSGVLCACAHSGAFASQVSTFAWSREKEKNKRDTVERAKAPRPSCKASGALLPSLRAHGMPGGAAAASSAGGALMGHRAGKDWRYTPYRPPTGRKASSQENKSNVKTPANPASAQPSQSTNTCPRRKTR